MFGLSPLISLIIGGIAIAAFMGFMYAAWTGFVTHVSQPRVEAQIKADQKKLDTADAARAQAESDRQVAKDNVGRCESALKTQADAKLDADRQAARNLTAARDSKARADREAAAAGPRIATLQALAAAKSDQAKTCEQQLEIARPVLQEALRRGRIPGQGPK